VDVQVALMVLEVAGLNEITRPRFYSVNKRFEPVLGLNAKRE
jgi:hypothetical protein